MSGQSIVDRLNAAKHTVAGSALGRAVVKATTEEIMGPKRKHLDCKSLLLNHLTAYSLIQVKSLIYH